MKPLWHPLTGLDDLPQALGLGKRKGTDQRGEEGLRGAENHNKYLLKLFSFPMFHLEETYSEFCNCRQDVADSPTHSILKDNYI